VAFTGIGTEEGKGSESANAGGMIVNEDILKWCEEYTGEKFHSAFCDPPYELGFMGKSWDSTGIAFDPKTWKAISEHLYPGAYLLAFGGTRTFHRIAVAIEDAGFEIRDTVMWVYGSGFPKSHDVSKAIDKNNGEVDRLPRFTKWMRTTGLRAKQIDDTLKEAKLISATSNFAVHYFNDGQPAIPTAEMWKVVRPLCGEVPPWVDELVERIEAEREVIGKHDTDMGGLGGERLGEKGGDITIPKTDQAKQWSGYGTALKPSWEPVIIARLPLEGTVAQNAQKYGSGALNIDGCRVVAVDGTETARKPSELKPGAIGYLRDDNPKFGGNGSPIGRWPANLIHDGSDEVVGMFPHSKSGAMNGVYKNTMMANRQGERDGKEIHLRQEANEGSAARFFYSAKVSKRERDAGLDGFRDVPPGELVDREEGSAGMDSPRAGAGRSSSTKNHHPTLKPISLTTYLAKLILPPKLDQPRRLLVPFAGSGSEVIGGYLAGWDEVLGVEREQEYVKIAEARIKHWTKSSPQPSSSSTSVPPESMDGQEIFDI
jgi:DNA modification methylase